MIDYSELMKVNELIHNQLTTVSDVFSKEERGHSNLQTKGTNQQIMMRVESIKVESEVTTDIGYQKTYKNFNGAFYKHNR